MTRKAKIWLVAILALAAWTTLSWFVPRWLDAAGTFRWVLFGSLAAIGAFGAVFTALFLTRRPPPPPAPKDPLSQEVEAALGQAERLLIEGRVVKSRGLQRLPVILLLGGKGQHKTSTVAFSGAQAELLAGDVMRGVQVNPTQAINIWLARPALIVEPGVEVLQDPQRRARLWHRLQPARLAEAVRSGEQAPRAVVVCASCEQFRSGASLDAGLAYARELRQTLGEMAHAYGVRLPVYVVFTAADKIPGFREYTKHLTTEEVREVLGVTLPLPEDVPASRYVEYATTRARQALGAVFRPLAERRHAVLMGLPTPGDRGLAYQFPRELRKAEAALVQFLVELVKPSDLQVNPFLRGFYFSGVREVIRHDAEPMAMGAAPAVVEEAAGATALLSALPRPGATPAMGARPGAAARVPEWVFLHRIFSGVLLNDPVAFGVTRGGTRVSYFRRLALGVGVAAAALLLIVVTLSFGRNLALARDFARHRTAAAAIPAEVVRTPTVAQLALLDTLGNSLDEVSEHVNDGVPWTMRWGLSQSARLYPAVRSAYFRHFGALLFSETQRNMLAQLRALPPAALGGREYEGAYRRLKAHLVTTTQYHDSSTVEFLSPVLLADWPARGSDTTAVALARRQFDRFARELQYHDLYQVKADTPAVRAAREAINRSSGDQPIYQAVVADAKSAPSFRFSSVQGTQRTLVAPYEVPGAFTTQGWDLVNASLRNLKRYLTREVWVVGPDAPPLNMTQDSLERVLRARYELEYAEHWTSLLRSAEVVRFTNLQDAARRLQLLGSNASEYLVLFAAVNQNLPADSQRVARFFKTVRSIGAPSLRSASLRTDPMGGYLDALTGLAGKVQVAASTTEDPQGKPAFDDARNTTEAVRGPLNLVWAGLDRGEWESLRLQRLLEQPLDFTAALLQRSINNIEKGAGAAAAGDEAAAFCQERLSPLTSKRPFVSAGNDVTPEELADVFGPNGALANLTPKLASVSLTPEASTFLSRLRGLAAALYPSGSSEAVIRFEIAPDQAANRAVSLTFGGRPQAWPAGQGDFRSVTWNIAVDDDLVLAVPPANDEVFRGRWALKNFFQSARQWTPEDGGYRFIDSTRGVPFRVRMAPAVASLLRGDLALRCPTKWTR